MNASDLKVMASDNQSYFRISSTGKVRFIMMPQDKVVYIGHFDSKLKTLIISKLNMKQAEGHHSMGVPTELLNYLVGRCNHVILHSKNDDGSETILFASTKRIISLGNVHMGGSFKHSRTFLAPELWSSAPNLDHALEEISKAQEKSKPKKSNSDQNSDKKDTVCKEIKIGNLSIPANQLTPEERQEMMNILCRSIIRGQNKFDLSMKSLNGGLLKLKKTSNEK